VDLLDVSGCINYFGKASNYDDIKMTPLLFTKGNSKLALYGLGNIRDERLHRTFVQDKVKLVQPPNHQDWFNLFVIHQNRFQWLPFSALSETFRVPHGGPKNFIPEKFLSDSLDLVIWGHEHECLIEPAWNPEREFFVSQPGSSVVTSLSEGEAKQKYILKALQN